MLFSLTQLAAPANLTVTPKPKYTVLSIDPVGTNLNRLQVVTFVRYASLVDADADANRVEELVADEFSVRDHAELIAGVTYYYRAFWSDTFGNISILAPTVAAKWKAIKDDDIETGAISTTKTKQRSKNYSGTTTIIDTDFVTVAVDNVGGNSVRISWEWILSARYAVAAAGDASVVSLIATLWKKHGSGAKQNLHTIDSRVSRHAGNKRQLRDSTVHKSSKVFHDPKPKRGDTTTYGVDVFYKGSGAGIHKAAMEKCDLNITYNKR
jgi:hypothetical protein